MLGQLTQRSVASVVSDSFRPHGLQPARLLYLWASPGKSTGVGCHAHLQGNLPDPGIKPTSPTWQAGSLSLNHWGSPILTLGEADLGCKTDCWGRRGAFWLQAERPPALHSPVYSRPRAATTLSPPESVAAAAPCHGSWLSLWETRESHQLGRGATPGPPSCGLEIPPGVCQRRWALRG